MRTMLTFIISFTLCTALLPVKSGNVAANEPAVTKPNIVLFFIDDWGPFAGSRPPAEGEK